MPFLTKMMYKEFLILFGHCGTKMWVQVGSKMAKKVVFTAATLLPTQFSLKTKFATQTKRLAN